MKTWSKPSFWTLDAKNTEFFIPFIPIGYVTSSDISCSPRESNYTGNNNGFKWGRIGSRPEVRGRHR